MTEDINRHLDDLIADINKVRVAVNNDDRTLDGDTIKCRLSDISNLLNDLYNDL